MTPIMETAPNDPTTSTIIRRSPKTYVILVVATILLGLVSRKFDSLLPFPLHKNAGDLVWAVMAYWIVALTYQKSSSEFIAGVTAITCIVVEILKLVNSPFLDTIRNLPGARLIFGYVFGWQNLFCYGVGIGIGYVIEKKLINPAQIQPAKG